eukprot:3437573-Alexandrium_andersonii.AAC.1
MRPPGVLGHRAGGLGTPAGAQRQPPLPQGVPHPPFRQARVGAVGGAKGGGQPLYRPPAGQGGDPD